MINIVDTMRDHWYYGIKYLASAQLILKENKDKSTPAGMVQRVFLMSILM